MHVWQLLDEGHPPNNKPNVLYMKVIYLSVFTQNRFSSFQNRCFDTVFQNESVSSFYSKLTSYLKEK